MLDDHVLLDCKNPSLNIRRGAIKDFRGLWGTLLLDVELRKSTIKLVVFKYIGCAFYSTSKESIKA